MDEDDYFTGGEHSGPLGKPVSLREVFASIRTTNCEFDAPVVLKHTGATALGYQIRKRGRVVIIEAVEDGWEWLAAIDSLDDVFVYAALDKPEEQERPEIESCK